MLEDKCDIKFNDIFAMMGADRSTFEEFSVDLSGLDETKLCEDVMTKDLYMSLKYLNGVNTLIQALDKDGRFKLNFDCVHEDIFHANVQAKSAGVGALGGMIFNAATMKKRQELFGMLSQMQ